MITFEKLRYKNFLSTGNTFTEIDFEASPTTLVVGHNGAGKSTMLDALAFALFGKPHRKISKMQLINSINQKGALVEVEFRIGSNNYKIVRAIKPNKFEVWVNGNMVNQSSHAKDYQSILEKNILMLSHKSFHQIVVLGSSSFVPFMQLSTGARRDVIEDLLDINMFSKMNVLLKEKIATLKVNLTQNGHEIEVCNTKINAQKRLISELVSVTSLQRKQKTDKIIAYQEEIKQLNDEMFATQQEIDTQLPRVENRIVKTTEKKQTLNNYSIDFKGKIRDARRQSTFFGENEQCPTCDQQVTEEHRKVKIAAAESKEATVSEALTDVNTKLKETETVLKTLHADMEVVRGLQTKIAEQTATIRRLNESITSIQNEIVDLDIGESDLSQANTDLDVLREDKSTLQESKYKLTEDASYQAATSELLKDQGIKSKIIKQYLPVINQLTNQYLQILDFFVHFDLDESFNETIRSRHRDAFTYDSFSEGEKQRIDLSLLFTWRQIAKMKNSVATNLLVLDETFDSSLDADGVDNLMKIIYTLGEDTNVFVISHKGELEDAAFSRKIEFIKERNFSKIMKESA
jgi:DNA repair exonuclease SbcCD ATPase subunit